MFLIFAIDSPLLRCYRVTVDIGAEPGEHDEYLTVLDIAILPRTTDRWPHPDTI
jgi:hypothetical protein